MKKYILLSSILFSAHLNASILKNIYEDFSNNSNLTTPHSVQDQRAGYATAGGLVVRSRSMSVNPFQLSLPSINAGCGKIDAFFGSMSIIRGQELVQLLQNMGTAAASYGVQLAIKTMAPEVEALMAELRDLVMRMNAVELDSCQMGMHLVGGMLPKGTEAERIHCHNLKQTGGEDSFFATSACKDPKEVIRQVETMKRDAKNADVLQGAYNLTWHIAKKLNFDERTALFAMSALGTIVSKKEGDRYQVVSHRGFGASEDFLEGYLKGGQSVEGYACVGDTRECLDILKKKTTYTASTSLLSYFQKWIGEMQTAYKKNKMSGSRAVESQSLFSDAAGLPLLRYIEVSAATGVSGLLDEALEYMARQILIRRIERLALELQTALAAMAKVQLEDTTIESFKVQLDEITESLRAQSRGYRRDALVRLDQQLVAHERAVKAMKGL